MALAWLILFLGSWLRLLTISGQNFHHGATFLALAPLGFVGVHHFLPGALRAPEKPFFRWALAVLTALLTVAFVRLTLLRYWDPAEWMPTILLVLSGLGIALFAGEECPDDRGAGPWLWTGFWMLNSARDPVLGMLGAGLAPLVFHWGVAPRRVGSQHPAIPFSVWVLPFLLGLFLPKPWWDWGLRPAAALPLAAFGVGGALAMAVANLMRGSGSRPSSSALSRVPGWILPIVITVVGVLYTPAWGLVWGASMGVLAAIAHGRWQRPLPMGTVAGCWILGMLLSFTLQANAWLPGLGHLIWLGN